MDGVRDGKRLPRLPVLTHLRHLGARLPPSCWSSERSRGQRELAQDSDSRLAGLRSCVLLATSSSTWGAQEGRSGPSLADTSQFLALGLLLSFFQTSLSLFTFIHCRRKWQPTPVFLPGESQGRGSLVGCRLWGRTESDTTEAT